MLSVFLHVLSAALGAAIFSGIYFVFSHTKPRAPTKPLPDRDGPSGTATDEYPRPNRGSPIDTTVIGCYGRKHDSSSTHPGVLPSDKNLAFIVWPATLRPRFDWPPVGYVFVDDLRVIQVRGDTRIDFQSKSLLNLIGASITSLITSLCNDSMVLAFTILLILDRRA
jgi:hypothetical protein